MSNNDNIIELHGQPADCSCPAPLETHSMKMTKAQVRLEEAVDDILTVFNIDTRPGCKDTPKRVAKMYMDIFAGTMYDDAHYDKLLGRTFGENYRELIAVTHIPFYSMCEHHLVPFHGVAHVGYIPCCDEEDDCYGAVVGLSKIARLVDDMAKQPQVQERLTFDIARTIERVLRPAGVMVILQAEHLCMTMRGIKKPGCQTTTSVVRGVFRDSNENARQEFLECIKTASHNR